VAQAAVTDVAPPEERARLLGLLGAAFGAGFALGPAIGGVAALVSHRLPFFIAAAIAAINALAAVKRLPETHPDRSGVNQLEYSSLVTPERTKDVRRFVLVTFVSLVAFSGFEATFSLLTEARFNLSESATYGLFFLIGLGLVVVQGGAIHTVVARLGEVRSVRFGLACNAIGLALVAVDAGWATLTLALALLIIGQGVVAPTLSSLVAASAHDRQRGAVLGIQQSAGGLARSVGPAVAGYLFGQSVAAPYVVGAALVVLALLLVTDR
jgi:predicted MFS family arabinose efflux permease